MIVPKAKGAPIAQNPGDSMEETCEGRETTDEGTSSSSWDRGPGRSLGSSGSGSAGSGEIHAPPPIPQGTPDRSASGQALEEQLRACTPGNPPRRPGRLEWFLNTPPTTRTFGRGTGTPVVDGHRTGHAPGTSSSSLGFPSPQGRASPAALQGRPSPQVVQGKPVLHRWEEARRHLGRLCTVPRR